MKEFKGKVAVITGAASGIGRAIAGRCVREDMKVVLADIEEASLEQAETELKTAGGTVLGVRIDVSKRGDVERLARQAFDKLARCTCCSIMPVSPPVVRPGTQHGTIGSG